MDTIKTNRTEGAAIDDVIKHILREHDKGISPATYEFAESLIGNDEKKLAMLSLMGILMEMRPSLFLQMVATVTYKGKVIASASLRPE